MLCLEDDEQRMLDEEYSSATDTKVDTVIFDCPHCILEEILKIAQLLNGRKVSKGVRLWIGTSQHTRALARRMGLVDIIEDSGGWFLQIYAFVLLSFRRLVKSWEFGL
jgi:predicted aconitase